MAYEFKLPDLGEGLTEGEIARWLVAEGQQVAEDEPLVEIQTDKTTVEIPSPAAGTVLRILVGEGEVAPVGAVLVVIGEEGEAVAAAPASSTRDEARAPYGRAPSTSPDAKVRATPLVRRIAQELGVDIASVTGSGSDGRVTEDDVRAAVSGGAGHRRAAGSRSAACVGRSSSISTAAHREIPAVTFVEECDFTDVDLAQLVPLTLKATALALQEFPELNARLEGDEIVYLDRYDLGVAVQTDAGLVVPVVRDCDTASLDELAAEVERLAASARAGTLTREELRGSTFTVTSAGKLGGLFVTPLINHPEVAILGVHRIAERPVVRGATLSRAASATSPSRSTTESSTARAAAFALRVIGRLEGADP